MKNIKKIEQLYTIYEQPMYRIAYAILKMSGRRRMRYRILSKRLL